MSLKGLVRDYKTHGLQPVQTQEAMVYVMATFDQYRSMDASRRGYWRQSCFRFVRSLFRPHSAAKTRAESAVGRCSVADMSTFTMPLVMFLCGRSAPGGTTRLLACMWSWLHKTHVPPDSGKLPRSHRQLDPCKCKGSQSMRCRLFATAHQA